MFCSLIKSETIEDIVRKNGIPSKKIKEYLKLDKNFSNKKDLALVGITKAQTDEIPKV